MTDVKKILEERGKQYGSFAENAGMSQSIKVKMQVHERYHEINLTQREALDMIALKLSRIVTGDPNYIDNWDDIAGYATLVADELRKNQEAPKPPEPILPPL